MVYVTSTTPFQGCFVIHGLALDTVNPYAKFELFKFTRYEDMKGDNNVENRML